MEEAKFFYYDQEIDKVSLFYYLFFILKKFK